MILTTLIDGKRETRTLEDGTYVIGRGATCRIRLQSPDVSERHAVLTVRGSEVTIEDLRSANGVAVNGELIESSVCLDGGKVVQLGNCMLRVSDDAAAATGNADGCEEAETDDAEDFHLLDDDMLALQFGPIERFLADDSVSEIMVNGPDRIYVERNGKVRLTDERFDDEESVVELIERIVEPLGRRIDESSPYVDARLKDGSRVNAIIAPLSLSGPVMTIRKFVRQAITAEDLIRLGTWTHNASEFMKLCVLMRKNIVVSGGTGSGKTTLLNALSGCIREDERIITVEDAAELRLQQPHVVRLEARPADIDGRGEVSIRDLVRNCLRMRPDRIIVGECRGSEALDMLQAMNTGHDGSLTTVHANSPHDVMVRLETMVMMGGVELPSRAIREQIAGAVDVIIHEERLSDGSRKVTAISEVTGIDGDRIEMQDIFQFRQSGVGMNGRVVGALMPTGAVPTWFEQLQGRGIVCDGAMFDSEATGEVSIRF